MPVIWTVPLNSQTQSLQNQKGGISSETSIDQNALQQQYQLGNSNVVKCKLLQSVKVGY